MIQPPKIWISRGNHPHLGFNGYAEREIETRNSGISLQLSLKNHQPILGTQEADAGPRPAQQKSNTPKDLLVLVGNGGMG